MALLAATLLCWCASALAVEKGQPLGAALAELRGAGLQLIFSSALIEPDMVVELEPGTGQPEDIARRILVPHGLTLETVHPGLFAVVKAPAANVPKVTNGSSRVPAPNTDAQGRLYEVDVYASRYEIAQQATQTPAELTRKDIEALPGMARDVMRVTRFLPGTAATALSARTHVRGGREDELAVYFDGVPLFEPFHYKDVQSLLGILDPDSISKLDFFSGAFPVRYGNRLSGVLDIQPRTWSGESYDALGASFLYSRAVSQGRLSSRPVEWLASVRRGNVDLFSDLMDRQEAEPAFLDALARVQVELGPRSSIIGGWLLLDDSLTANLDDGAERGKVEYRDATGWVGWQFRPSDATEVRATASRTERHTNRDGLVNLEDNSRGTLDDRRRFDTSTLRLEATAQARQSLTLNGGLEWYEFDAQYDYSSEAQFDPVLAAAFDRASTFAQSTDLRAGGAAYAAYVSALVALSPRATLDLALRWDTQRFHMAFRDEQLSPRVTFQFQYDPTTALRVSWGRFAQTARPDELQVQDADATFHPAQRSAQSVVSIERQLAPAARVRLEAYDKRVSNPAPLYENLLDPFVLLPELQVDRVRVQPDSSRMYGAELSALWQVQEAWSGWASYSWSSATDRFGTASVPRTWDQRHSVTAGLAWSSRPWQLSANLAWHSGWRRNGLVNTPAGVALEPRNARSWPAFASVDLRAAWTRPARWGTLQLSGDIINAANRGNLCCSTYGAQGSGAFLSQESSGWLPRAYMASITWQLR